MTSNQTPSVPERSLASAIGRAVALMTILALAFFALRETSLGSYIEAERLGESLARLTETKWAAPALVALYVILAPLGVPISPLVLAGGAVFGLLNGWLLNLAGALLGGLTTFLIGQKMGRDLVLHLVSERNLARGENLLEQHGFWAIVRIRFLPIPFAIVNYGCALVGVRLPTFLVATSLGLTPSLLVYTALSYALVSATAEDRLGVAIVGALALAGLLTLTFVPTMLRMLRERRARQ